MNPRAPNFKKRKRGKAERLLLKSEHIKLNRVKIL